MKKNPRHGMGTALQITEAPSGHRKTGRRIAKCKEHVEARPGTGISHLTVLERKGNSGIGKGREGNIETMRGEFLGHRLGLDCSRQPQRRPQTARVQDGLQGAMSSGNWN